MKGRILVDADGSGAGTSELIVTLANAGSPELGAGVLRGGLTPHHKET
ncbi:MAG: hypothetical protein K2X49_19765 [Acetobacteraceae bacterium]|nr:hypothetical protein [Acetobacteraceae bacterium]